MSGDERFQPPGHESAGQRPARHEPGPARHEPGPARHEPAGREPINPASVPPFLAEPPGPKSSLPPARTFVPPMPRELSEEQPFSEPEEVKERRRPGWIALIVAMLIAMLGGGAIGIAGYQYFDRSPRPAHTVEATGGTTEVIETTGTGADWQAVAAEVAPTVVAIDVASTGGTGQGSGVIIDAEGLILTNEHVVDGATKIFVTLSDFRVFEAEIVGEDQATDLAVIRLIDAPDNLTVAQLGDSSTLAVGQEVAAIGNPMGLATTLTTGVISALDRPTQPDSADAAITNAIQIDAAINPGNSGGPVFDENGYVIGIASSIISVTTGPNMTAGSIGLGFAIPVNQAKTISAQLIENGVAEHAYLGVIITNGLAEYDGTTQTGAYVTSVQPGTPAANAGIQVDDVVLSIDGKNTPTSTSLTGFVRQHRSGDVVTLVLERGGELIEIDVTLATRPD
ncbi:MAG: trypsin-like peptidase domain-containing protein [Arcanobacterium sp.]